MMEALGLRRTPRHAATMSVLTMRTSRGAHEERARQVAGAERMHRGFADVT